MADSQKSSKKSWKTGKNTENVAGNWTMPFRSHGKLKKICGKPEKAYFSCRKPETVPGETPYSWPSLLTGRQEVTM